MQNVLLIVLLLLALALIGIVLLQRSEGGGLGMGGGGGAMSQRSAANAMTRLTWILGAAFMVTSLALTILAAANVEGGSVLDRLNGAPVTENVGEEGDGGSGLDADSLLPPPSATDSGDQGSDDAPLVPRAD